MKIKSSFNYFLSALLSLCIVTAASANTEKFNLNISATRVVSIEVIKGTNPALPTFLFLPGVNRGLFANEGALEVLSQKGFGIVTMNFSTQPFSVNQLQAGVAPEFLSKSFSLEDLGTEVTALTNELKNNFGIKNVIPVSISYSAAVSSTLQNIPLLIDAAPMTSSAAVNPQLENYRATLKAGEIFNPIYGPALTRSLLDQTYYTTWTKQVDAMISQFDLNADRRPDMIKGYSTLSRAAEGFVWDIKKTKADTKRIFILGRKDSASLLKNQLELVLKALDANADMLAFLVNDAGHVIPSDQPAAYATILTYVASTSTKGVTGIFEVQPGAEKPKFFTGAEAKKYIKNIIDSL